MDAEMLKRPVNVGFSGGEKKRAEMVQMGIMEPRFAMLDETDSGLDIDALQIVGAGINRIMRAPDKGGAADHPLPAPARLCAARPRARAVARPDRPQRRPRARARARARRLCGGGGVTALSIILVCVGVRARRGHIPPPAGSRGRRHGAAGRS